MKGQVCIIIPKIKHKSLMKDLAGTQQPQAMPQISCRIPVHSLLPLDNPVEIIQPYRKEESVTGTVKVLDTI